MADSRLIEKEFRRLVELLEKFQGFKTTDLQSDNDGLMAVLAKGTIGINMHLGAREPGLSFFVFDNSEGLTDKPYGRKELAGIWLEDLCGDTSFPPCLDARTKTAAIAYFKVFRDCLAGMTDDDFKAALNDSNRKKIAGIFF